MAAPLYRESHRLPRRSSPFLPSPPCSLHTPTTSTSASISPPMDAFQFPPPHMSVSSEMSWHPHPRPPPSPSRYLTRSSMSSAISHAPAATSSFLHSLSPPPLPFPPPRPLSPFPKQLLPDATITTQAQGHIGRLSPSIPRHAQSVPLLGSGHLPPLPLTLAATSSRYRPRLPTLRASVARQVSDEWRTSSRLPSSPYRSSFSSGGLER